MNKSVIQKEYRFVNSKNSKKSKPHRQLLNLSDKINLKRSDKNDALSKITKTINLQYPLQPGMKHLNYLIDNILYQIFKTISSVSTKA